MKFSFKFSNLLGAVYKQGSILFSSDGNKVLSPVGNRISQFDLKNNKSCTFPFENQKNIYCFTVSPDGSLLISVDEDGKAILVNLQHHIVLHSFNFKSKVYDIRYSPNGKYVAVTHGKSLQLWHAPGRYVDFAPFHLYRKYPPMYDDTRCIDWSDDSRFVAVGSRDMSCRVYSSVKGIRHATLLGHRSTVCAVFFEKNSLTLYTVSKDGAVIVWEPTKSMEEIEEFLTGEGTTEEDGEKGREKDFTQEEEEEEEETREDLPVSKRKQTDKIIFWKKQAKHLFSQDRARVTCATLHKSGRMLITGFNNGVFTLHEMPDFNLIHSLSISEHRITSVSVNSTGEWLAFGSSTLGQLLVWEWQSETYILKQQSHNNEMNAMCYSPDGQLIATGGDDGKVKLWNTSSGFCFVTFSEHTAPVTSVLFNASCKFVVSGSLDGTVRAYDLQRYRNFRTLASPRPVQFRSLALDISGEVVAAGSVDTFEIFVWSMKNGRLLEILTGHEGPVSGLAFSPSRSILGSSSWDKTVKLWDVFESKGNIETLPHSTDVLTLSYSPDGSQLAVATLDGVISLWDVNTSSQIGTIEGRNDLEVGRRSADKITAKRLSENTHFTTLCYTADGQSLLAGGRSKFVCLYDVRHQQLLKKYQTSNNQIYDGMKRVLSSRNMTEAGPLDMISDDDERDSDDDRRLIPLPGVRKGDYSSRKTHPEIRTKSLQFSPTGKAWSAVTTEGLLVFTLDSGIVFDPFDLTVDVTVESVRDAVKGKDFTNALIMSLRLNEPDVVVEAIESIPVANIELILNGLSPVYIERLLPVLAERLDASPHIQYYITWSSKLLSLHTETIKQNSTSLASLITDLQKSIIQKQKDLGKL
ncbi:PREDICTED: periodic tryptophan protein 2 homolog [Amphimedon queenslandica]|uniref:Small-subunit processome Utp12 domain-containing protein n=1 Tax=Amphimedon queenslandica TaxID=400682 RepID=A0AAN0IMY3_AMPQE|nr:PREDICTED: periodic tryptophan protein 2 homolog [Amphimedon queenslandica]|eukprot:XP_011404778.1 PREDICTED: periodic tryptophan protein 2 homolog [Amphimedon queenslandica]